MNSPANFIESSVPSEKFEPAPIRSQPDVVVSMATKPAPYPAIRSDELNGNRLLPAEEVAERLNVTKDWVWDHSSRKAPFLPVIRIGDGTLRYRASKLEEFINERERLSVLRRKRR